jgi:hypothetical protein
VIVNICTGFQQLLDKLWKVTAQHSRQARMTCMRLVVVSNPLLLI